MKIRLITAAVATASLMTSGVASADNAVATALENTTFTGSVYGAYRMTDTETAPGASSDTSDFDIDAIRAGFSSTIKEDTVLNVELGYNPGDNVDDTNDLQVRLANIVKSWGNTSLSAGRYRSNSAVEDADELFTEGAARNTAPIADGLQLATFNDAGLHGTVAVRKGGVDTSTIGDSERNLGYDLRGGWVGGDEDMSFGVTVAYTDTDGDETPTSDAENDGYGISAFIATGPVTATLEYSDSEAAATNAGVTVDTETDSIDFDLSYDLGGANRSFNHFGVRQGPTVAKGETGYEIVFAYSDGTTEDGTTDTDNESFSLGVNAYCGPNTKWYLEYTTSQTDDGIELDTDVIAFGGRLNW